MGRHSWNPILECISVIAHLLKFCWVDPVSQTFWPKHNFWYLVWVDAASPVLPHFTSNYDDCFLYYLELHRSPLAVSVATMLQLLYMSIPHSLFQFDSFYESYCLQRRQPTSNRFRFSNVQLYVHCHCYNRIIVLFNIIHSAIVLWLEIKGISNAHYLHRCHTIRPMTVAMALLSLYTPFQVKLAPCFSRF